MAGEGINKSTAGNWKGGTGLGRRPRRYAKNLPVSRVDQEVHRTVGSLADIADAVLDGGVLEPLFGEGAIGARMEPRQSLPLERAGEEAALPLGEGVAGVVEEP